MNLPQDLFEKLALLSERTHIKLEDCLRIAVNNYVEEEELRLRMEDDYEHGVFAA